MLFVPGFPMIELVQVAVLEAYLMLKVIADVLIRGTIPIGVDADAEGTAAIAGIHTLKSIHTVMAAAQILFFIVSAPPFRSHLCLHNVNGLRGANHYKDF